MYIPLPDIKARLAMLKKATQKNNINLTPQELNSIAELSEGYILYNLDIQGQIFPIWSMMH